jgi:DNA-binding transcriptional regulator YbjK
VAVTNRTVAQRAGVSLGSLTYHFESQTALLRESLELFLAEEVERLGALADGLREARLTPEQGAAALEALLEQDPERRIAKLELYLHAARDTELRPAALECFAAYDRLAESALAALGIAGDADLARVFVAVIDGLQLRRLASGEEKLHVAQPLEQLLRQLEPDSETRRRA